MSTAHKVKNIERQSTDLFLVRNPDKEGRGNEHMVIHREQVKTYFEYDCSLRCKHEVALDTPVGYHSFREAHNREAKSKARFAYYEVDDSRNIVVVAEGPSPTRQEVLGNDADLRSQEEVTGGQTLSSGQMDTINALLWDTAERIAKGERRNLTVIPFPAKLISLASPDPRGLTGGQASQTPTPTITSLVAGPSTFDVDHAMAGDEGFEEDVDALGEDDDEAIPEHEDGATVGKHPGKSA
ncbi:hypothetical protein M404DRAFT_36511 [Pisolithus tinctorius Marx 270]|uniref:Uncharacterized protein n=1 Tax=Pisolithus tinctorius Marx 270 TaxID=870435 RepID=A0A0C3NAP9_PISTI|nr:hypothetical protein M404DRAFT_36511 [Pisolithus tinctorius Marx 270]